MRDSLSLEENASFLVRWAVELFCEWATWIKHILPGISAGYKSSTLRIVNKIKEMQKDGEISNPNDGWKRITDMLRASYVCNNAKQVLAALDAIQSNKRVKILRIKPRFGP